MFIVNDPGYSALERKLIGLAYENIWRCTNGPTRHISFLLKKKKILSMGWSNSTKSNPLAERFGYWNANTHSELSAITKFPRHHAEFGDTILYNIRIDRYNIVRESKPCKTCMNLIAAFGIKDVAHTNNDGVFEWL